MKSPPSSTASALWASPTRDRPKLAHFLEMEGRVPWICYKQTEILSRNPLNRFWELLKIPPEAGSCPMHLKFLKRTLFFGFKGFGNQKVQFSTF